MSLEKAIINALVLTVAMGAGIALFDIPISLISGSGFDIREFTLKVCWAFWGALLAFGLGPTTVEKKS